VKVVVVVDTVTVDPVAIVVTPVVPKPLVTMTTVETVTEVLVDTDVNVTVVSAVTVLTMISVENKKVVNWVKVMEDVSVTMVNVVMDTVLVPSVTTVTNGDSSGTVSVVCKLEVKVKQQTQSAHGQRGPGQSPLPMATGGHGSLPPKHFWQPGAQHVMLVAEQVGAGPTVGRLIIMVFCWMP
jgi:hypothetical protein